MLEAFLAALKKSVRVVLPESKDSSRAHFMPGATCLGGVGRLLVRPTVRFRDATDCDSLRSLVEG